MDVHGMLTLTYLCTGLNIRNFRLRSKQMMRCNSARLLHTRPRKHIR